MPPPKPALTGGYLAACLLVSPLLVGPALGQDGGFAPGRDGARSTAPEVSRIDPATQSAALERHREASLSQMERLAVDRALLPGDRLVYQVVEDRDPPRQLFLDERGQVNVPLIGLVPAKGLTCRDFAFAVKEKLEEEYYYWATVLVLYQPDAAVTGRVSVMGEVLKPGYVPIPPTGGLKITEAVLLAGGALPTGDLTKVSLIRRDPLNPESEVKTEVDIDLIIKSGDLESDLPVEIGDLILVPPNNEIKGRTGGQIFITGEVRAPGLLTIPATGLTVSKAILGAGGFTKFAKKKRVKLIRSDTSLPESERTIFIDMVKVLEEGRLELDVEVKPDDIIRVEDRWFAI